MDELRKQVAKLLGKRGRDLPRASREAADHGGDGAFTEELKKLRRELRQCVDMTDDDNPAMVAQARELDESIGQEMSLVEAAW